MDAWQRAIVFMRAVDARTAESVVPLRWGRAQINQRLNRVHDLNFLIADRVENADAADLDAEAERIQGDAGFSHRRRPDRDVDTTAVQEVDWKLMRPAREREIASQPWAADPGLVQQLLAKHELTAEGTRTRYFAALRAAAGFGFVFLVTVAEDWPQHFYRRLGFEPVGIESRFLRIIDA